MALLNLTSPLPCTRERLTYGCVTWTWCSKHMDRTSHIYTGFELICLECKPELRANVIDPRDIIMKESNDV